MKIINGHYEECPVVRKINPDVLGCTCLAIAGTTTYKVDTSHYNPYKKYDYTAKTPSLYDKLLARVEALEAKLANMPTEY